MKFSDLDLEDRASVLIINLPNCPEKRRIEEALAAPVVDKKTLKALLEVAFPLRIEGEEPFEMSRAQVKWANRCGFGYWSNMTIPVGYALRTFQGVLCRVQEEDKNLTSDITLDHEYAYMLVPHEMFPV